MTGAVGVASVGYWDFNPYYQNGSYCERNSHSAALDNFILERN